VPRRRRETWPRMDDEAPQLAPGYPSPTSKYWPGARRTSRAGGRRSLSTLLCCGRPWTRGSVRVPDAWGGVPNRQHHGAGSAGPSSSSARLRPVEVSPSEAPSSLSWNSCHLSQSGRGEQIHEAPAGGGRGPWRPMVRPRPPHRGSPALVGTAWSQLAFRFFAYRRRAISPAGGGNSGGH